MGGDGGVFAVNRKFFAACRNTSKDGQTDATENEERHIKLSKRSLKSRTCAISSEDLIEPIVTCRLGFLYNKENLITALLDKTLHSNFSHIKSLKHVKEVILTRNSDFRGSGGDDTGSGGKDDSDVACPYMCPVTQLHFNGVYSFVAIWTTGYVLSDKAIREIGIDGLQLEYGPFAAGDVVGLLPSEEVLGARRAALEAEAEMALKAKVQEKQNKKKRGRVEGGEEAGAGQRLQLTEEGEGEGKKSRKKERSGNSHTNTASTGCSSAGTASLSSGVVDAARKNVTNTKGKSALYEKLFHQDAEKGSRKPSGTDLFMSVSGIRYTL